MLLLICAVASLVVMARRTDAPWALSFRFYVYFAVFVVVMRVLYRIVLGGGVVVAAILGGSVVLSLVFPKAAEEHLSDPPVAPQTPAEAELVTARRGRTPRRIRRANAA